MKRGLDRAAIGGLGESVSDKSMSRLGVILLLAFSIAIVPPATAQIALGSFVTLGSPADPPSIGTGAGVFDINPDPKKTVKDGPQTYHEMMNGFLFYVDANEKLNLDIDGKTGRVK